MTPILDTGLGVFIGLHVILLGGAAFLTGQAVAATWRPVWQAVFYCLLLGVVARFLTWSLFDGILFSASGYLVDVAVLVAIGLFAYQATRARKMAAQYPWLYRRKGLLGYEAIGEGADDGLSAAAGPRRR